MVDGGWIERPTTIYSIRVDEPDAGGVEGSLSAGLDAEFGQDAADVALDGPIPDRHLLRDLLVRETLRQQPEDFGLALGQRLGSLRGGDLPHQSRGGLRGELHL